MDIGSIVTPLFIAIAGGLIGFAWKAPATFDRLERPIWLTLGASTAILTGAFGTFVGLTTATKREIAKTLAAARDTHLTVDSFHLPEMSDVMWWWVGLTVALGMVMFIAVCFIRPSTDN